MFRVSIPGKITHQKLNQSNFSGEIPPNVNITVLQNQTQHSNIHAQTHHAVSPHGSL